MSRTNSRLRLTDESTETGAHPNSRREKMKYILMMSTMKAGHCVPAWPKKDLQAHIAFMHTLNKGLIEAGELVSAEGLSFPDQAKLIRAGKNGAPITDGVFPESKELDR